MKEIFDAITAMFNSAPTPAFNTAVGGRFFLMRAPQSAIYPYCVYSLVESVPGYTFSTAYVEATVQFSISDKGADNSVAGVSRLLDAQSKLWSLYDFAPLAIAGYSLTIIERVRNMALHDPETGVTHSITQYYLRFSK
jgi:hypothetical protein